MNTSGWFTFYDGRVKTYRQLFFLCAMVSFSSVVVSYLLYDVSYLILTTILYEWYVRAHLVYQCLQEKPIDRYAFVSFVRIHDIFVYFSCLLSS